MTWPKKNWNMGWIYSNFFKIKNQYGFLERKIGTWMKMEKNKYLDDSVPRTPAILVNRNCAVPIWQVLSCSATTSGGDSLWWARAGALSLVTLWKSTWKWPSEGHSSIKTGFIMIYHRIIFYDNIMIILWSFILSYITYHDYHISRCYVRIPTKWDGWSYQILS